MKTKHTPELYARGKRSLAKFIYMDDVHIGNAVTVEFAKRILTCLNACAGMLDPAAEIAALRARIAELEAKVPTKPQPNWNDAPEWAQWWAVDANEIAWWYTEKPKTISSCWLCNDGRASCHDTINLNGYDWRETLTPRP